MFCFQEATERNLVWTAFMTDGDGMVSEIPVLLQKEFYINKLFLCTEE